MSEKIIKTNRVSYDKDDIMREIEKELKLEKEIEVDNSDNKTEKTNKISKKKKVNKIINNKNDLIKGVLLSEILGKPKGRR